MKDDGLADGNMQNDEQMDSVNESEGEDEIILIEEEYKSVLDDPEHDKNSLSRQDFKFLKLIGSGAHAKVYLARKEDTQQLFAIKVLEKRELNKKKQNKGTKVERRILVSIYNQSHLII
jgi:serine/threonine protein kinase